MPSRAPQSPPAPARLLDRKDWALLLLAPVTGWLVLRINLWNAWGYLDPWIYTGAGQAWDEFVAAYGFSPYYLLRFPVVFLNTVFCGGDSPVLGYAFLRYLILLGAGGALYVMAKRFFGRVPAAAAYLFLFCNPLFLRIITWDYPNFLSIPAALAGVAVWLGMGKRRLRGAALAGACFAVSVNSHLFTATAILCFAVSVGVVAVWEKRPGALLLEAGAALLGFAAVVGLGIFYFRLRVPAFDPALLWQVPWRMVKEGSEYASIHTRAFELWGAIQTYVYIPYVLLLANLWLARKERLVGPRLVLIVFGAVHALFYLLYRFALGKFVWETHFYFSHIFVSTFTLVAPLVAHFQRKLAGRPRALLWAAGAGLMLPVLCLALQNQFNLPLLAWTRGSWGFLAGVLASSVLAVYWMDRTVARGVAVAICVFCIAVQALSLVSGNFRQTYWHPGAKHERELYATGVQFARIWARYHTPGARSLIWYYRGEVRLKEWAADPTDYSGIWDLDLVSVSYAGMGDTLNNRWKPEANGVPEIGEWEFRRLREHPRQTILILATDPRQLDAGFQALEVASANPRLRGDERIVAGEFSAFVRILSVSAPPR